MTDLSERTDAPGPLDVPGEGSPVDESDALAPVIHFVPVEGEQLEHLATERRGPLRWMASLVLSAQAVVRKESSLRSAPEARPSEPAPAGARRPGRRRAEMEAARRRRLRRARRSRGARAARQPLMATATAPATARATTTAPATSAGSNIQNAPDGPEPMPGSGWTWSADDERSWEAWEANATAGDTDGRLASLGTELERPLPAPVRLAHRVGGRRLSRGGGRRRPPGDDD